MYEHLASFLGGPPNEYHFRLYSEWAKYDWGMVVTGNVQTTPDHLTLGRDNVLPSTTVADENLLVPFQKLAQSIHGLYPHPSPEPGRRKPNKTLAIMQLNHPGRQSSNFIGGRLPFHPPLAPSSIPLQVGYGIKSSLTSRLINFIMFQTPRTMSHGDIQQFVKRFIDGAVTAHRAGFDGVQLHVAHGCKFL
jgi:2,4-dienoyl-CoA reductase-like NADH-dependent reductase (Old Yellow Enzyme family)